MEASLHPKAERVIFPDEPSYGGIATPIYWEPIMGSGEKISAIVAVQGVDGQIEVVPAIKPSVLAIMFPGQKRNALNMLSWVSSSLKRHLLSGLSLENWKCPVTGFVAGRPLNSLGEDISDIVSQIKLLHCSLSTADHSREEAKERNNGNSTDSIRESVLSTVRLSLGTEAERFIVQDGIKRVRERGRDHFLEITFEDNERVGAVVSAFYSTTDTVKKHILGSQTDLLVASQGAKSPVMYIAAPKANSSIETGNAVDELEWRLSKMGVKPEIFCSAKGIAESVCENWA